MADVDDDDDDDVLLLTATYCVLRLRQIRRKASILGTSSCS